MKKFLVSCFFVLITVLSFCQNNYQDVVYLKNGSIIRGTIIEQIPNQSIKIETADRSIFVYQISDVEKITKETIVISSNPINEESSSKSKSSLFFIAPNLEYNYILDLDDAIKYKDLSFCIDEGLYLFKNFSVNTTLGLNYYKSPTITTEESVREPYIVNGHIRYRYVTKTYEIKGTSTTSFVYGAGVKYYFASKIPLSISFISIKHKDYDAMSSLNFMLGYKWHLSNERVSFEPSIGYVMGIGDNESKMIQARLGFSVDL